MKNLILCAGKGERLRPLTLKTPKPLVEVNGIKLIDYNLNLLHNFNFDDIVVNVSYLADQIIDYLGESVIYSYEKEPLGTAGAMYKLRNWFDSNFMVVNGDTIHVLNLDRMLEQHLRTGAVVTVFTKDTAIHNGGVFMFNYRVFMYWQPWFKSIHEDLLPQLTFDGLVGLYGNDDEYYFDIGTPEKLKIAQEALNEGKKH